jgi:hypothetical protein
MANQTLSYGNTTSLTVTGLSSLGSTLSATSNTVDNTTDLFIDIQGELVFTTVAGAVATGTVELWGKASIDNTDFDDDVNDRLIGVAVLAASGIQTRKRIFSLASAFGGTIPPYWQIRVRNATGGAFNGATIAYRGVFLKSV